MSNLTLKGNASGSGTFTLESPNSNTSRTLTLPDATTTLVGTDATQTLTNKTIQGGALTLMTAQASTSGTAIDFTGIPTWAKRITVILDGVSTNGTSVDLLQLGDAGGFENTGYTGASGYVAAGAAGAVTAQTAGFGLTSTKTAASALHATITLTKRENSANTWVFGITGTMTGGGACFLGGGGTKTLSDTLTQVRITTVAGTDTFDAGTINILVEG